MTFTLDQMTAQVFRRTELGNKGIRERTLSLSKEDELVLLSVDGITSLAQMAQKRSGPELETLRSSIASLHQVGLIEVLPPIPISTSMDPLAPMSGAPDLEEFFSSSLHPIRGGSGLVVDTKANTMRTMRDRRAAIDPDSSVDFLIPLEGADASAPDRKRLQKLVEVYPNPAKSKKRKRKSKSVDAPEKKWLMWIYLGVIVLGVSAVLFAVMFS